MGSSYWKRNASAMGFVLIGGSTGCGPGSDGFGELDRDDDVGRANQAIQLAYVDINNQQGTTMPVNMLTTGSSTVVSPFRMPASSGGMCGATFIAKHYAITAAHCVNEHNYSNFQLEPAGGFDVLQVLTTNLSPTKVQQAAVVTGTWPNWTIAHPLTAADGYQVTPFQCKVLYRCASAYGTRSCPFTQDVDIAVLHCPNRPSTGYVNVETTDPTSGNIVIDWFHEILNLQTSSTDSQHNSPTGNWTNYGSNISNTNCFHYTNSGTNQFLPLQSINFPGGTRYKITAHASDLDATDAPVCHGTSGSGVFLAGTSGYLGPVTSFGIDGVKLLGPSDTQLCETMELAQPGKQNSSYPNSTFAHVLEAFVGDK